MKVDLDITHIYKSDDEWRLDYLREKINEFKNLF